MGRTTDGGGEDFGCSQEGYSVGAKLVEEGAHAKNNNVSLKEDADRWKSGLLVKELEHLDASRGLDRAIVEGRDDEADKDKEEANALQVHTTVHLVIDQESSHVVPGQRDTDVDQVVKPLIMRYVCQ